MAARYCEKKYNFEMSNIRDVHHDMRETIEIEGFEENKDFLFLDANNRRPCYMNYCMNLTLALLGLSWIPRIVFNVKSFKVNVAISKLIID